MPSVNAGECFTHKRRKDFVMHANTVAFIYKSSYLPAGVANERDLFQLPASDQRVAASGYHLT